MANDGRARTIKPFVYAANPARIVFGAGTLRELGNEVRRLGRNRAVLISDAGLTHVVERAANGLGPLAVARFDGVAMHTPVDVTETRPRGSTGGGRRLPDLDRRRLGHRTRKGTVHPHWAAADRGPDHVRRLRSHAIARRD